MEIAARGRGHPGALRRMKAGPEEAGGAPLAAVCSEEEADGPRIE